MRFIAVGLAAVLLFGSGARAEMSGGKVKIGVLTDLSGPYEQNSGIGSVEAANMAAEEFGNKVKSPAESKGEWDLLKLGATLPGDQVFRPIADGGCPAMAR